MQVALLEATRGGKAVSYDVANVPKLVAVAGQTTSLTFNGELAKAAILTTCPLP
jgi:hypothetical protein